MSPIAGMSAEPSRVRAPRASGLAGLAALATLVAACPSSPPVAPPPPPRIEGIGVLFRVAHLPDGRDLSVVDRLVVDGPAARAGVLEGEGVWTVDGVAAAGLELMEVVRRVRGPEGTVVVLGLGPEAGPTRTLEVVRGAADTTRLECLEGDCTSGRGVRVDAFGDLYEGEFADGKPQGKGKLTTRHGRVYNGDFHDGAPHGLGIQTTHDGVVVTGRFAYGAASGPGKIVWPDGRVYEGWVEGARMQGEGTLTQPATGDVWSGTFRDDHMVQGQWRHTPGTDGRRCTRKVESGVAATVGVIEYPPADPARRVRFEGQHGDDCVPSGKGTMYYATPKRPVAGHYQGDTLRR